MNIMHFIMFVHSNYVHEDWDVYKKIGRIYIFPFWFIRACIIWLICPLFIPKYLFKQSYIYKRIEKIFNSYK